MTIAPDKKRRKGEFVSLRPVLFASMVVNSIQTGRSVCSMTSLTLGAPPSEGQ